MVEKADSGCDPHSARPVEIKRDPQGRFRRRPDHRGRTAGHRRRVDTERAQQNVVVGRPAEGDPDATGDRPDDETLRFEPRRKRLLAAHEDEVCGGRRGIEPGGAQRCAHTFPFGDGLDDIETWLPKGSGGDPCSGTSYGGGRTPLFENYCDLGSRNGIADSECGEAERLRHRAQDDQVRCLYEERDDRLAAELDVCLVDDDRNVRHRAG